MYSISVGLLFPCSFIPLYEKFKADVEELFTSVMQTELESLILYSELSTGSHPLYAFLELCLFRRNCLLKFHFLSCEMIPDLTISFLLLKMLKNLFKIEILALVKLVLNSILQTTFLYSIV